MYDLCTNCMQEVLDPTNPSEEERFVHVLTLAEACQVEDLPSDFSRDARVYGIEYVACPDV